jgi:hypothetical protein
MFFKRRRNKKISTLINAAALALSATCRLLAVTSWRSVCRVIEVLFLSKVSMSCCVGVVEKKLNTEDWEEKK